MGALSSWSLQEIIYTLFEGDSQLSVLVNAEYDFVPEEAIFPFLVIGNISSRDNSAKDISILEHSITIHAFSRGMGKKEANSILGRVYELLHNASLSLSGNALINLRFVSSDITIEDDGITYHGIAQFRAVVSN